MKLAKDKQEEIRDKLINLAKNAGYERETIPRFTKFPDREAEALSQWAEILVKETLSYLHSQDVVIKVDNPEVELRVEEIEVFGAKMTVIIPAGYVAVEPLIEK